jgi:hypothetical protein
MILVVDTPLWGAYRRQLRAFYSFILAPFRKSLTVAKCDTEICARRRERRPGVFARKSQEVEADIGPIQP